MQRISNQAKSTVSELKKLRSVRVRVSEEVAVKIRKLSDQMRIPSELVATEAIRRGMAVLVKS